MLPNVKGFIVASNEGPTWDMEVGRPATFKVLSDHTWAERWPHLRKSCRRSWIRLWHIHNTSDELIFIVSGQFSVRLGEKTQTASTGAWIFIPMGSVHGWRNSGTQDGRMFYIFSPATGARPFEDMRHQGKPLPDIDPDILGEIFAKHGHEIVAMEWE